MFRSKLIITGLLSLVVVLPLSAGSQKRNGPVPHRVHQYAVTHHATCESCSSVRQPKTKAMPRGRACPDCQSQANGQGGQGRMHCQRYYRSPKGSCFPLDFRGRGAEEATLDGFQWKRKDAESHGGVHTRYYIGIFSQQVGPRATNGSARLSPYVGWPTPSGATVMPNATRVGVEMGMGF